jgi:hypothetical protein
LIILSLLSSGLCQLVYKRLSVNMLLSCLGVCHVCCVSRLCILLLLLYLMPFLSPLLRIIAFTSLTLCSLCYNSMLSLNALLLPFFPSAPLISTYLRWAIQCIIHRKLLTFFSVLHRMMYSQCSQNFRISDAFVFFYLLSLRVQWTIYKFCPHCDIYIYIYICYEECLQYIPIISLDSIKRFVFKMDTDCVPCALGTEVLCMKI